MIRLTPASAHGLHGHVTVRLVTNQYHIVR